MLHFKQPITFYVEQPSTQEVGTLSRMDTTVRKSKKRHREKVIQETATASLPPPKKISLIQDTPKISIKLPVMTDNTYNLLSPIALSCFSTQNKEEEVSFMKMMWEEGQYMRKVLNQSPKGLTTCNDLETFEMPTFLTGKEKNPIAAPSKEVGSSATRKSQDTSISENDMFVQQVLKEEEDIPPALKLEPQPISPLPDDHRDITIVDVTFNEFPVTKEI